MDSGGLGDGCGVCWCYVDLRGLILPVVLKDGVVRWGVAGGLGVAVAALGALWGHSFATAGRSREPAHISSAAEPPRIVTGPGTTRNKITGGTFNEGPVIQGRDIFGSAIDGSSSPRTPDAGPQE